MTEQQDPIDWIPLLLQGELDAEQARKLKAWKDASSENQEAFDQTVKIWEAAHPIQSWAPPVEPAWEKLRRHMAKDATSSTPKKANSPLLRWAAAAAVIAIVATTAFFQWDNFGNGALAERSTTQQKAAEEIMLADGTKVWLNKESTLQYPEAFEGSERIVYLEGEAFFDVARDVSRPFSIRTKNTETQVLGTSFNVRAYPDEETVEVLVATGKVAFRQEGGEKNQVLLNPADKGLFNKRTKKVKKNRNEDPNILSWNKNKLEYDNTGFEMVKKSLERHFNVEVEVENQALYECRFTSTFKKPKLESILTVLAASLNFNYEMKGDKVKISGEGCSK